MGIKVNVGDAESEVTEVRPIRSEEVEVGGTAQIHC
jgi:hypothetical protein